MAPAEFTSADTNDDSPSVGTVETKATLTLPGGWCCGFAYRRAEDAAGRLDIETVFVTRGGLRMAYRREWEDRRKRASATAPSGSVETGAPSESMLRPRGSRVDLLV